TRNGKPAASVAGFCFSDSPALYYVIFFIYGVKKQQKHRTTLPALALISIWLSIKQFGIKTPKSDAMILAGIILSGSFSGVMTFI
ncbi:putative colanic acid polymerase WcaD, partial [Salmonella enterica subsp. enterica serovar Virginia]|nr:putative colanic acid polymerase WcaD [Salmonella enterica subsp. enterica serovar Virginia]